MANSLRFYLDENLPVEIACQLLARGIDAVTARDLEGLGDEDANHLQRATRMRRVLCTYDPDFLRLASQGERHSGIVFGHQREHYVGACVKYLESLHTSTTPQSMKNQLRFVS